MKNFTALLMSGCALALGAAAAPGPTAQSQPAAPLTGPIPATSPSPAATAPASRQTPRGPQVEKLTLRPALADPAALRLKLLPDLVDQNPGDAVPLYLLSRRFWPESPTWSEYHGTGEGRLDYQDAPVDRLPPEYVDRILNGYAKTLQYADWAARRREAHWDAGWRELGFGDAPLPYLNDLRHVANLLAFRARVQVYRKDWAGAERTMQTGFGMARHLGEEPLLIHALVEVGFVSIMLNRGVTEWVGREGSPNLYWALTDLPRPFIDLWPIPQWEREALRYWKPEFARAVRGELPADGWPRVVRELVATAIRNRPPYKPDPARAEAESKRQVEAALPRAKQFLVAAGTAPARVEGMTPEQVVGTYWLAEFGAAERELWKGWTLPYPEAEEQIMRAWRALAPDRSPAADNPAIQFSFVSESNGRIAPYPNMLNGRYQFARLNQFVGLLRTVEALRDYAARHDGRPPERLDQVTDLPVPIDAVTGKPFGYRLDGRTATLDAPAPTHRSPANGYRYELTFEK